MLVDVKRIAALLNRPSAQRVARAMMADMQDAPIDETSELGKTLKKVGVLVTAVGEAKVDVTQALVDNLTNFIAPLGWTKDRDAYLEGPIEMSGVFTWTWVGPNGEVLTLTGIRSAQQAIPGSFKLQNPSVAKAASAKKVAEKIPQGYHLFEFHEDGSLGVIEGPFKSPDQAWIAFSRYDSRMKKHLVVGWPIDPDGVQLIESDGRWAQRDLIPFRKVFRVASADHSARMEPNKFFVLFRDEDDGTFNRFKGPFPDSDQAWSVVSRMKIPDDYMVGMSSPEGMCLVDEFGDFEDEDPIPRRLISTTTKSACEGGECRCGGSCGCANAVVPSVERVAAMFARRVKS